MERMWRRRVSTGVPSSVAFPEGHLGIQCASVVQHNAFDGSSTGWRRLHNKDITRRQWSWTWKHDSNRTSKLLRICKLHNLLLSRNVTSFQYEYPPQWSQLRNNYTELVTLDGDRAEFHQSQRFLIVSPRHYRKEAFLVFMSDRALVASWAAVVDSCCDVHRVGI